MARAGRHRLVDELHDEGVDAADSPLSRATDTAAVSSSARAELPGSELVEQGLADLAAGRETEAALLLEIAAPRLRTLGIGVRTSQDESDQSPEHRLYALLSARADAHSRYNALLARIASYARAAEQHATPR